MSSAKPGDYVYETKLPWATWTLLFVMVVAFAAEFLGGESLIYGYSLTPEEIVKRTDLTQSRRITIKKYQFVGMEAVDDKDSKMFSFKEKEESVTIPHKEGPGATLIYVTLLTSMFMHVGPLPLAGSIMFLFLFGSHLERILGSVTYLVFFFLFGIVASVVHIVVEPKSLLPALGAAGAVAGILGACVATPTSLGMRVLAVLGVPLLFLTQRLGFIGAITEYDQTAGATYWQYLAGFATGLFVATAWSFILELLSLRRRPAPPVVQRALSEPPEEVPSRRIT